MTWSFGQAITTTTFLLFFSTKKKSSLQNIYRSNLGKFIVIRMTRLLGYERSSPGLNYTVR